MRKGRLLTNINYLQRVAPNTFHRIVLDRRAIIPIGRRRKFRIRTPAYYRWRPVMVNSRRSTSFTRAHYSLLPAYTNRFGIHYIDPYHEQHEEVRQGYEERRRGPEQAESISALYHAFTRIGIRRISRRTRRTRRPFKRKRHKHIRMLRASINPRRRGGFRRWRHRFKRQILLRYYYRGLFGVNIRKYKDWASYVSKAYAVDRLRSVLNKWGLRLKWQLINVGFTNTQSVSDLLLRGGLVFHNGLAETDPNAPVESGSILQLPLAFFRRLRSTVARRWYAPLLKTFRTFGRRLQFSRVRIDTAEIRRPFGQALRQRVLDVLQPVPAYYLAARALLIAVMWRALKTFEHAFSGARRLPSRLAYFHKLGERADAMVNSPAAPRISLNFATAHSPVYYRENRFRYVHGLRRREIQMFGDNQLGYVLKGVR